MVGMVESLNVSVAAGIILSEALHQRRLAGLYRHRRLAEERYQQLFFEWAHPKITQFCLKNGLAYPPLREDGDVENPSRWYAEARELIVCKEKSSGESTGLEHTIKSLKPKESMFNG